MHDWLMLVSIWLNINISCLPSLHVHVMHGSTIYYIVRAGSACVLFLNSHESPWNAVAFEKSHYAWGHIYSGCYRLHGVRLL